MALIVLKLWAKPSGRRKNSRSWAMVQILVFVAQEGSSRKSLLDLFVMFCYSEINVKFRNLELFLSSDKKVRNVYTVLSLTNN